MNDLEKFVLKHLELLKLEQDCEVEESQRFLDGCSPKDLQSKGVALLGLIISSRRTGELGMAGLILIGDETRALIGTGTSLNPSPIVISMNLNSA